jgi:Na+-transporting NADH:ubiquinone oxidoreductase subunit C
MSLTLEASQDPAGIKRRSNLAEIYLVRDPKNAFRKWCFLSTATACGQ